MQVLILDDADTALKAVASATGSLGHDVESTADPAEFYEAARHHEPDLQIVDFNLPGIEEQLGLRDGPELVAVSAAKFRHVPTVFLTEWKPDCEVRVAGLDPRLLYTIVEKPMGLAPQAWREVLDDAISEITSQPTFGHTDPLGVPASDLKSDFFRLTPHELDTLSEDARDALETEAVLELHESLLPIWEACEEDWLMLQRVGETILVIARGTDDSLPAEDSVRDLESDRDSGTLVIGRPTVIEEIGIVDCSPTNHHKNWRRYPFVRLIISDDTRDFHLDTGSAESFISREYLSSHMDLPPVRSKRRVVSDLMGRQEVQEQTPIDVEFHVSGPDGNAPISMRLHAVKKWRSAILNPACDGQRCPDSVGGQCGRRMGLMGRDLLYRFNRGVWSFDPKTGRFYPRD